MKGLAKTSEGKGKNSLTLHHAYGLSGPREEVLAEVFRFIESALKLPNRGNPDVHVITCDSLSIEESRRIKEIQSRKAFGDHKAIIAAFNTATSEAQNALLKILEEPVADTHIFLILPRLDLLLTTVRSRLFTAEYAQHVSSEVISKSREFFSAPIGPRLTIAKKIADDISDEKIEKDFVLEFLNQLETELWERKKDLEDLKIFDEIALCRTYLSDRSASVKMLLEHLAVALPSNKR